ncbi:MAG: hypothetical protein AB8E82_16760 [Aureispira sp.]
MNLYEKIRTAINNFIAAHRINNETETEQPTTIESLNTSILSPSKLNVIGEDHGVSGQNRQYEKQLCQEIIGGSYWEEGGFNVEGQDGDSPILRIIHSLNQVFNGSNAIVSPKVYIETLSDEELLAELEGEDEMDESKQSEEESSSEQSEEFDEAAERAKMEAELDALSNEEKEED